MAIYTNEQDPNVETYNRSASGLNERSIYRIFLFVADGDSDDGYTAASCSPHYERFELAKQFAADNADDWSRSAAHYISDDDISITESDVAAAIKNLVPGIDLTVKDGNGGRPAVWLETEIITFYSDSI